MSSYKFLKYRGSLRNMDIMATTYVEAIHT